MIDFTKFTSRTRDKINLLKCRIKMRKLKMNYVESHTCLMNFNKRDKETIIRLENKLKQRGYN